MYEAVSKKLGIDIVKEQSLWTADDREANAQFIAKEMKVLISSDAQSEFTDTVHELGHLGEVTNKAAMQKVRQAVLDWHNETKGYNSTEDAISRFEQAYNCSREDAIEEYTNEALSGLFSTDEGVKDFLSWLEEDSGYSKKEKKTVIQKIAELFDRLVEAIKNTISSGQLSFAAKDFAQMQADRAAKIRKMFLDVLDGTSEQSARMSDEVKNSIKKTQNMSYDEQIEKIFSKRLNGSNSLYIGKPSEKLIKAGFSNAPFAMNQSDIRKSHEATAKNKNYSRHGVSIRFFEQMPERLNNAVMFIKNKNGTTVITDYQMNDRNGERSYIVAGIWHDQKMESDTVNQVKSVYPLEDFKTQIFRAAENGTLAITDKKKAQAMLATIGVQPSEVSRLLELSNNSISQAADVVNTKNSLKLTDSEGNELSAEQREFFKNVDSSLKDEQGRLKPFYHGTARADRVGYYFDPERATSGPMAFFTDNKQIADNYARNKADTSLAYDGDYDSYETQFRVNVGGESIPVASLWGYLTVAQKNAITQKAQQLTMDDDYETFVLKPGNKYGNGGFDLRYAKGNAIQALIDSWLAGGYFVGEEENFLDVLKAVGINNVEYKNPDYREEKTYEAYLNITNPFNTDLVDAEFIDDLTDYVENTNMSIYEKESAGADMWDKNDIDIFDWIDRLQDDFENGTTYSWTSIPDVVTDFLKEYGGYDGIIDRGGKQGGEIHTVAIPFYSNQIKEITNKNPTTDNPDIRYSLKGISRDEVDNLQNIGKKSVNQFTQEDIKTTEDFAKLYYKELGTKSPFFRSWFGDWREYDTTPITVAKVNGAERGKIVNTDTGWKINVSGKVFNETKAHKAAYNRAAVDFLPYIDDIVKNAVLLDSFTIDKAKSSNSLFMHSFYAVADIGNGREVLKLYVEEMNDPNQTDTAKRAYQLQHIEKYQQSDAKGSGKFPSPVIQTTDINTVSDLFSYVKQKDSNFKPNRANTVLLNEDGTPKVFFHSTNADFTVFKQGNGMLGKGIYFSDYSQGIYGKNIIQAYLTAKNPVRLSDLPKGAREINSAGFETRVIDDFFEKFPQYDAIVSRDEIVVKNSAQIKSATDNVGTFSKDSPDIRYSLRHSLGIADNNADSSLLSQLEEQKKLVSHLQGLLGMRHFVDMKQVRTLAGVIKKDYNSTIGTNELVDMLGSFYESVSTSRELSWDVVEAKTKEIAEAVVSKSKNITEITERSKEILANIRSVAVRLSDKQKAEVAHRYGSYNDFRRRAFGSLKIRNGNDIIELDSRYSELSNAYPDLFPADVSEADQPALLLEAYRSIKDGYYDSNGFDYDSAVDYLKADIYEKYFEIPDSKNLADDYRLKLNRAKLEMRKELEEAKTEFRRRTVEEVKKAKAYYEDRISLTVSDINERYDERLIAAKARYEQRVQNIADTNSRAAARKIIVRKVKRLSNILLKTSNKPGYVGERDGKKFVIYNNIPEELRAPVSKLCELLADTDSVFEKSKLDDLKSAYGAIRASAPSDETFLSGRYDAEIEADLEELKNTVAGKKLSRLSASQLETVKKILDHFDTMIKNETEIFVNGRAQLVSNLGEQELNDLRAKGRKKLRQLGKAEKTVDAARKFAVNNYKPIYFFEKVGGVFKPLFNDIRKGQDKYVRNIEPIKGKYDGWVKKYGVKKALRDNDTVSFTTERNEKLDLTLQQRMLIYATAKREQLSGQKSLHLMTGGVVFENQIQKSGEKTRPWKFRENDAGAHRRRRHQSQGGEGYGR